MNKENNTNLDLNMKINLRKCDIGEQFTSGGKCQRCETGYSLIKMTEPGTCETCPTEKAICNGGSNIGPKAGFWRSSNISSNFI